jgi:hypothetical protein
VITSQVLALLRSVSAQVEYKGLICRGVEEMGSLYVGQPYFGPHLVSLFVTGRNPFSVSHTLLEHIAWVNDPLHSYVADGTGGMVIFAHPEPTQADFILSLDGLTGMEVNYKSDALSREALWDRVLTVCAREGRPFIWGFGSDDTHYLSRSNLSWFAARVPEVTEFALKKALREGAFYISNGPLIRDIQVSGSTITLHLPEEADVLWLRDGQYIGTEAGETVVNPRAGADHCLQWDRGVAEASFDCANATDALFVRAVVRVGQASQVEASANTKRNWASVHALVAQTQPFRLDRDGTIANPYPASGQWLRGQTHNHCNGMPGDTQRITQYRLCYQAFGQLASFSTDYYWEWPYQWLPSDGTPKIQAVRPYSVTEGSEVETVVTGLNFSPEAQVRIGGCTVPARLADGELKTAVPDDLPVGIHDVTVTNPDGFRDTYAQGFTIRRADAALDGWTHWDDADGLPHPQVIAVGTVGDDVYACTITGVGCYRDGAWTVAGMLYDSTYSVIAGPDGAPWIAGAEGIYTTTVHDQWVRHRVEHSEKLPVKQPNEQWGRLSVDSEGQIWAGHRWRGGLGVRRTDGRWERLTTGSDGLPNNSPSAGATDTGGILWGGFTNGLYRLHKGEWWQVDLPDELRDCHFISVLAPDADGGIWAAVTDTPDHGGVVYFDAAGGPRAYTPDNSPLPSTRIHDILVTRAGEVWFASDVGVAILSTDGVWRSITSLTSGLGCNIVLGMDEGPDGSIWFATPRGVSRYVP